MRRRVIALSADGRTLWTADTGASTITAYAARDLSRRHAVDVGAAPTALALLPDGRHALVTTGFYDDPGLALVDLRARTVLRRFAVGAAPCAIALAGRTAWIASGGDKGRVVAFDVRRAEVQGAVAVGCQPRDLALTADGRHLLVPLNGEAAVAVVSVRDRRVTGRIATAPFPFLIAAAPQGDRAFVSHDGFGADRVSMLDLGAGTAHQRLRTGADPAGLAFAGARTLLVAERGSGTVSAYDAHTGLRTRRFTTSGRPRAVATSGRTVFAADEETGQLWRTR